MERAEVEPALQEHIHNAFVSAGFTEAEWVALYAFKIRRNENNHVRFKPAEAYDIVSHIADTPENNNSDLRSGLNKAIAFHESRGSNWMDRYP